MRVNDDDDDRQESDAVAYYGNGMKFMTMVLKFMARMLMKVTMAMTALKALRPPTRSRPSCFALRQCSHCHHQSLVMITMMIMTVMRS